MCISGHITRRLNPTQAKPVIGYRTWALTNGTLYPISWHGATTTWATKHAKADVVRPAVYSGSDKGLHARAQRHQHPTANSSVYGRVALYGPTVEHRMRRSGAVIGYRAARATILSIRSVKDDTPDRVEMLRALAKRYGVRFIGPRPRATQPPVLPTR